MPSPDISYVLDSLCEMGAIGPDVYHHIFCHRDADDIIDNLPRREVLSFEDDALYLENAYLESRSYQNKDDRVREAVFSIFHCPRAVDGYASYKARCAVGARSVFNTPFDPKGLLADHHARSFNRVLTDLRGLAFGDVVAIRDEVRAEREAQYAQVLERISAAYRISPTLDRKTLQDRRKSVRRSVALLGKIIGPSTVRMFVKGECFRVEGELAVYEFHKASKLHDSHGGSAALLIFDKNHPDLLLGRCCVYTRDVPLADHVAGLIARIKSGLETEILEIGNISPTPEGLENEIIKPYLPKKTDVDIGINSQLFTQVEKAEREGISAMVAKEKASLMQRVLRDHPSAYPLIHQASLLT